MSWCRTATRAVSWYTTPLPLCSLLAIDAIMQQAMKNIKTSLKCILSQCVFSQTPIINVQPLTKKIYANKSADILSVCMAHCNTSWYKMLKNNTNKPIKRLINPLPLNLFNGARGLCRCLAIGLLSSHGLESVLSETCLSSVVVCYLRGLRPNGASRTDDYFDLAYHQWVIPRSRKSQAVSDRWDMDPNACYRNLIWLHSNALYSMNIDLAPWNGHDAINRFSWCSQINLQNYDFANGLFSHQLRIRCSLLRDCVRPRRTA